MARVAGKVALVTGGALGLGKAAAEMLAREGAKVAVTDVNVEEGQKVAAGINANGGHAIFVEHNVSSEDQWKAATKATLDAFGRLDILVNNAGIGIPGNVEDTTLEDWRKTQNVNLDGVFLGTKLICRRSKG
jgi:NAD(P)-dependent dehydrogenase (short-subunit alcohol dehydrogenase family)